MSYDMKYTKEDLKEMQSWPLDRKIQVTQARLIEWYNHFAGEIYISFSGGKDSTVLADIAARLYASGALKDHEEKPITLVFVNTGLEYPEIQKFVKEFAEWLKNTYQIPVNLEILRPEMSFPEVILKYGYPLISKTVSDAVYYARRGSDWAIKRINGLSQDGSQSIFNKRYTKYAFLLDAPFESSPHCCKVMKKRPAKKYEKETERKPVVATMADESEQRKHYWMKDGCNAFENDRPISKPMSFWTNQDVLQYLKRTGIPFAPVYGEIVTTKTKDVEKLITTGCEQTGCMFCMFGIKRDRKPNRFQRMKETHPRQYEYCIGGGHFEDGKLQPDKNGLGLGVVLDYIGVPY